MAITSKGYTGSLNNVDWSVVADKLGAQFAVFGANSFAISTAVGDRAMNVRVGEAAGQGIRDISDEDVILTAPAVTSGDRWDMIALRRNWTTKTTSLVIVPGSSVKTLPATRERTVGAKVDHPLWLVRFSAGQNAMQERIDLRVWHGDGGIVANDLLVREFVDRIGTVIRIGNTTWRRIIDALGGELWTNGDAGETRISLNGGWSSEPNQVLPSFRIRDGMVSLNGRIRAGEGATTHGFTLPIAARPMSERVLAVMRPDNTFETVVVRTDGQVLFLNVDLPASDYRLATIAPWPAAPGY